MNEGWSAEQRARELAAAGEDSAGAWAAGAEGERRVAAALSTLPQAWTVLHDRLLRPGQSEANLDHVVIGPGGIYLIDAKNRAGRVTAWDGGLFQHKVGDGGHKQSVSLAGELAKVHGMAAYMAAETGAAVTPVLCLAGTQADEFGAPQMLRGVWVVPVTRLATWLSARPELLDAASTARAVTKAMTDFPSTATDPDLLAAMGAAARPLDAQKPRGKGTGTARVSPARSGRRAPSPTSSKARKDSPSVLAGVVRSLLGVALALVSFWALFTFLPPLLTEGVARMAEPPSAAAEDVQPGAAEVAPPAVTKSRQPTATAAAPAKTAAKAVKKPAPKPPRPVACGNASRAEVSKIVGRAVQPVAVRTGCAWGTRLDDPTTTLVSIIVSAEHAAYDYELETSRIQRRVVYGTSYDGNFRHATFLWVSNGQPIKHGQTRITARADTRVGVSRESLGVSDDRARAMALAIAAAVNRG